MTSLDTAASSMTISKGWGDPNSPDIRYEDEFEEMRCIGRGNFGAAFLVKLKNAPENQELYFIAKKVILDQLTPQE